MQLTALQNALRARSIALRHEVINRRMHERLSKATNFVTNSDFSKINHADRIANNIFFDDDNDIPAGLEDD